MRGLPILSGRDVTNKGSRECKRGGLAADGRGVRLIEGYVEKLGAPEV